MTQTIFKTPDAATGKTAKQKKYEKKMAKYAANKARKEQKERRERNNKRFNYSEYLNAPIASVKYLDDKKFEIVVGAGGDYHYDDEYDNAAVDILNTTTFVVERVSGKSGYYEITKALGKAMTEDECNLLEEKYRALYEIISQNFFLYHKRFDFTPKDFTHFVRELMRPLSMIESDRKNLKKTKQMYNNGPLPFFSVMF